MAEPARQLAAPVMPVPHRIARAVGAAFPGARPSVGGEEFRVPLAGREVSVVHDAEGGTARIDFGNLPESGLGPQDVPAGLRRGSLDLAGGLRRLAGALHAHGVPISYGADRRHQRLYEHVLPKLGYRRTRSVEDAMIPGSFEDVWHPAEAAHYAAATPQANGPSVGSKAKGATAKAAGPGGKAAVGAEPLPPVRQLRGRLAAGGLAPLLAAHDWQGARAGHHEAVLNHLKALPAGGFLDALHGLADAAASGHPHARGWAQWAAENRPAGPEVGRAEFGHRASVVDTSKMPEDEQAQAQGVLRSLPRLAGTGHPVAPAGFNYAGLLGEGVTSRPAGKGDLAMSHALASRPVHEQIAAYLPSPEQVSAAATAKGQAAALDANLQRVVHLAAGGERAGWEYAAGKGPADLRHAGMLHQSGQTVKPELDVKHLRGTSGRVKGAQENVRNKLAEATEDPRRLKASLAFNLAEDQPEEKRGAFLKFGVGGFTPGGKGSTQLLTHAEVQKLGTKEGAKLLKQRLESAFSRADLGGYGEELEKQKARMGKADARNVSKTLHAQTGDLAANFEAMFGDRPTPAMLKRLGEMRHYAADPGKGGGRWITIGSHAGEDGKKHGGTPVYVENGRITKGSPRLVGRKIDALKEEGEGQTARQAGASQKSYDRAKAAKEARKEGIEPGRLHQLAAEMIAHDREGKADLTALLQEVRRSHPHVKAISARSARGIDADAVKGLDDIAHSFKDRSEYQHLFAGHEGAEEERLFDLLLSGNPEAMGEEQAYAEALERLKEEKADADWTPFGMDPPADVVSPAAGG